MAALEVKTAISPCDGSLGYIEADPRKPARRVFFIEKDESLSHCSEEAFYRDGARVRKYQHAFYTMADMLVG
jgi:hypothetical protein